MGLHYKRTCPFCNHTLENYIPVWDYNLRLGPARQTCPQCGKVLRTGRRYWRELPAEEKIRVVIGLLFSIMLYAWALFLLPAFVAYKILALPEDVFSALLLPLAVISLLLAVAIHIRRLKKIGAAETGTTCHLE
jgi:hypothetical protein